MTNSDVQGLLVTSEDGRQLDVLVSGKAEAMPVVIHMGTPAGLAPLPSQIDLRRRGLRTVLYARPGYCGSTPQPGRSVADAAVDTATILDALRADVFLNVGWSMGGPHALACAALLAERCLATAVVGGVAPYSSGVLPEDALPLTRQGVDVLSAALEKDRAKSLTVQAEDMPKMFPSAPDSACLIGEYAEWLAAVYRAAFSAGIAGVRDDNLAGFHDWGFDLADARRVTIWQGGRDEIVTSAESVWLSEHLPGAVLRLLPDEGHISIGLRFPEVLDDLVARAGPKATSTSEPGTP
jgi:pimeloyl-ACP methyl ester carboxylesterase